MTSAEFLVLIDEAGALHDVIVLHRVVGPLGFEPRTNGL